MTISSELFLAILAMDSYNRGYNAGIKSEGAGVDEGLIGTRIGNADLNSQSSSNPNSAERQASFFAQSYSWNGKTVISYRGTDNLPPFLDGNGDWRDVTEWRQMVGARRRTDGHFRPGEQMLYREAASRSIQ